jgi:hypothetical protein
MSTSSGPANVTSGLIFDYDMSNTQKSWKGKPTTNLVTNPTNEVNGTTSEFVQYADLAPIFNTNGTAVQYSLSLDLKAAKSGSVLCYMQNGSSSKYSFVNQSVSVTTEYQRFQFNGISAAVSTPTDTAATLAFYGVYGSGVIPSIKNVQVEISPFATPFVNGSRSTTQNIVDLTGSSVSTSNLTYASNNTFSFASASANTISVPLATAFNKLEGSINMWIYPTSYNGGNGYFVNRTDSTPNALDWFWIGPYSGTFYFRLGDGSTCCNNDLADATWNTRVPLNTWHNVCVTWKSAVSANIYLDGNLVTTRAISAIPATNPAATGMFGLGHANVATYFDGSIPVAQIYNRLLSASEVAQNFNTLRGRYGI